ncbi:MAG: nucleoside deaminase [Anaerolineales bacterium]
MEGLDATFFSRAVELAHEADQRGNLPIGALIVLDGEIIAEGRNAIWAPTYRPNRHAELEALRMVHSDLWQRATEMTLYSTLEPCLMCTGAILLHRIGQVRFGTTDPFGGSRPILERLPPYFESVFADTSWDGPLDLERCQPLHERAIELLRARGEMDAR